MTADGQTDFRQTEVQVLLEARGARLGRKGASEREAMARGSAQSAPVIVDAEAIKVVVCRAFSRGGYPLIKILGRAIATSVLLDALLVTATAGRALLTLAGRSNGWPAVLTDPHA